MISDRLVRLIEDHSETIATRILQQIRDDPRLPHIGNLPEYELRARARDILKHLGHWLMVSREGEVTRHFEQIGAYRYAEGVPVAEVALAYMIVKAQMIQFVRDQGLGNTTIELYAEEELEHVVDRFFDNMLYNMIKGYEDTLKLALQAAARARAEKSKKAPVSQ
jgi:hypothetical protein